MKKVVISFLLLGLTCSLFANLQYQVTSEAYYPTSVQASGMGNGITIDNLENALNHNPALLAKTKFKIVIPSVAVSIYNVQQLLADQNNIKAIEDAKAGDKEALINIPLSMFKNLGKGNNKVASVDLGVGFVAKHIGFGVDARVDLHSSNPRGTAAEVKLIPEVNVKATFGIGFRAIDVSALSLNLGANIGAVYKAYMKAQNVATVIELMQNETGFEGLLSSTPTMMGWSIPVNGSVTLGLLRNQLNITLAVNNLGCIYRMHNFPSINSALAKEPSLDVFQMATDAKLNFGINYEKKNGFIRPMAYIELCDLQNIFRTKPQSIKEYLLFTKMGAELSISNLVEARIGLDQGYLGVGATLNLFVLNIEASYGWQEFGSRIGEKPVDVLRLKVTIGHE